MCIRYAFRPRVSSRLTLSGRTFLRKPYAYGGEDSHFPSRYLCRQGHFSSLHQSSRSDFTATRTLLYQNTAPQGSAFYGFGPVLEPRYIVGPEPLDQ
jgi:hypothetical protein